MICACRRARDPIEHVRTLLLEHELTDPPELKKLEKELKKVPLFPRLCMRHWQHAAR